MIRVRAVLVVVLLGALVSVAGSARPAAAGVYVQLRGAGTATSYRAIYAWTGTVAQDGMTIDFGFSQTGSTFGHASFADGTVDWGAWDVPYGVEDQQPSRGYTYMPGTAGATAFKYNLRIGNRRITSLRLSGENIAKIFTGVLTRWDDPAIAAENPGLALPAIPILPVVRADRSGVTWQFTRWMMARQQQYWTAYCTKVGLDPCTPTSLYPVPAGSAMRLAYYGDSSVTAIVDDPQANGAIGFLNEGPDFEAGLGIPAAKMLNAAGYYTSPTSGHVGIALLKAKVDAGQIQDLSEVYTNPDPRAYELSWYSYLIVPTEATHGFTTDKGRTLGDFGRYALCQGQGQAKQLGYAALPINLSLAGYGQLQRVPGAQLPGTAAEFLQSCANPTISAGGTDALAASEPMPRPCDQQGPVQCPAPNTTTTVSAQTDYVQRDTAVTLTARVSPSTAAGQVQFHDGCDSVCSYIHPIGAPVPVVNGVAELTTTFSDYGRHLITAAFTPADSDVSLPSASAQPFVIMVDGIVYPETIDVDVPLSEGGLTMTVDSTPVQLGTAALRNDHTFESSGRLGAVTISDGRDQTRPGWSVSGQISDFTSGTHTFSGNCLGWTPTIVTQNADHDAVAGAAVSPGADPGLKAAAGLATGGLGTTVLGADLALKIPSSTQPGDYTATLTITALTSS
ncbi:substrate-binding domain-containing protein [Dactylosporangium darangshiense]|uniref:substrate-binding domain-containing protein n=1 Tax=Dactylosporangium darangshiense TaxID=579108 RepID=UPI0031E8633C